MLDQGEIDTIKVNAADFIEETKMEYNIDLKYDIDSIKWLNENINQKREGLINWDQDLKEEFIMLAGSFFWEYIIHTFGGKWDFEEKENEYCIVLEGFEEIYNRAYPFGKVNIHIKYGEWNIEEWGNSILVLVIFLQFISKK